MKTEEHINYLRIAEAIDYIRTHFKQQPSLEEIAEHIHLSPFHFQRLFQEWAGISPKKFLQYTSLSYAKSLLKEQRNLSLFDTTYEVGLSSTSRLHDLFLQIEGMSPATYKQGGRNLAIAYSYHSSPFGLVIIASTAVGICYMAFINSEEEGLLGLKNHFPEAFLQAESRALHQDATQIFQKDWQDIQPIKLHLKGSPFQLKVWESLLKIPFGGLSNYGSLASQIGQANASRAVGTAIAANPVAFLIPCHRVIQSSGNLGGYRWGPTRKAAILGWEAASIQVNQD